MRACLSQLLFFTIINLAQGFIFGSRYVASRQERQRAEVVVAACRAGTRSARRLLALFPGMIRRDDDGAGDVCSGEPNNQLGYP